MTTPNADQRFCVCGWSTTDPEPHDHDQRTRENAIRNADALAWTALDSEIARGGTTMSTPNAEPVPRPPWNDPLAHVIGDALTSLGDGEYVTSFDEDETFERVVTVLTERVRAHIDGAGETP